MLLPVWQSDVRRSCSTVQIFNFFFQGFYWFFSIYRSKTWKLQLFLHTVGPFFIFSLLRFAEILIIIVACFNLFSKICSDWRTAADPRVAAHQFSQDLFLRNKDLEPLRLRVDIRQDKQTQDQALVHFYSTDHVQWARQLYCRLEGTV